MFSTFIFQNKTCATWQDPDACSPPTLPSLNPFTRSAEAGGKEGSFWGQRAQCACLPSSLGQTVTVTGREVACLQGTVLWVSDPRPRVGSGRGCGQEHSSHIHTSTVTPRSPQPGAGQELPASLWRHLDSSLARCLSCSGSNSWPAGRGRAGSRWHHPRCQTR